MMNVDLLLNQEIKYIIPIYEKGKTTSRKQLVALTLPDYVS